MKTTVIPCELKITSGGEYTQDRVTLTANGTVVFDDFEYQLTEPQLSVAKQIAKTHAEALALWSAKR